ncbi:MAG: amino acid permease [Planctomycetales bacterium]|nr:amino acid permease [Planctomycetales bacterium]
MPQIAHPHSPPGVLRRQVGLVGAVLLGLGSILGTGVFVSLALGVGLVGDGIVLAVACAALVALANGMSSAQLAANHPVSGGTYEYGYRWLSPRLGFAAGFLFLCAKAASAATAARGFANYLAAALDWPASAAQLHATALATVAALMLLTLAGIRRSNRANAVIVCVTVTTLVAFIAYGATAVDSARAPNQALAPTINPDQPVVTAAAAEAPSFQWRDLLEACALMFVAYTGYGRIATLGEEVIEPRRTIPRAIIVTLFFSALLYSGVAWAAIRSIGAAELGATLQTSGAPLVTAASRMGHTWLPAVMSVGAMTAMLGVLLNLILGLSRVLLAMGRRGDMPEFFGRLDAAGQSPQAAIIGVSALIAGLSLIGPLKLTWSFSAFTVLVYYAITNLAACRLATAERLYPRWISVAGLLSCLALAPWVETNAWLAGSAVLVAGLAWQAIIQKKRD